MTLDPFGDYFIRYLDDWLTSPELRKRVSAGYMTREVKEEDIDYSDIPEVTDELLRTRLKRMPRKKRVL